jgi:hypothetical protein
VHKENEQDPILEAILGAFQETVAAFLFTPNNTETRIALKRAIYDSLIKHLNNYTLFDVSVCQDTDGSAIHGNIVFYTGKIARTFLWDISDKGTEQLVETTVQCPSRTCCLCEYFVYDPGGPFVEGEGDKPLLRCMKGKWDAGPRKTSDQVWKDGGRRAFGSMLSTAKCCDSFKEAE